MLDLVLAAAGGVLLVFIIVAMTPLRDRRSCFLKHFKIGTTIAFRDMTGRGGVGKLVDLDELGVYLDMADGGVTWFSWRSIDILWEGPLAERWIKDQAQSREEAQARQNGSPALSPDEIAAMLGEPDIARK